MATTARRRKGTDEAKGAGESSATRLLDLIDKVYAFHAPDGTPYVSVRLNERTETIPIRSSRMAQWLRMHYFDQHECIPSRTALQEAVEHLDAKACLRGREHEVFLRTAEDGASLVFDLGDGTGRAVEVDADGWRVASEPLVRFRRSSTQQALPEPTHGNCPHLDILAKYIRLSAEDQVLLYAFLVQAVRSRGPYPALVFVGEQGSGKTMATEMVKAVLDPSTIPTRAAPRDVRDLLIAAEHSHVLAFNNLSGLSWWLSDALCTLLFGGGFATRRLHSNREEETFHLARPVILNGIEDLTGRPDFADRAIVLRLQPIPEAERKTEEELWRDFHLDLPRILGGLFTAVATAYRRLPQVCGRALPRMADFARWAMAAEEAFSMPHVSFLDAYRANRAQTFSETLDLDPVAEALLALVESVTVWEGTTSDLRKRLKEFFPDGVPSDYPTTAQRMAGRLRRIAPVLRAEKIEIEKNRTGRARTIRIRRADDTP